MPTYLKGYESRWKEDPHAANLAWFKDAGFGMFIHFSPASGIGASGWRRVDKRWAGAHGRNARLSQEDYDTYLLDKFEPQLMDPAAEERIQAFRGEKFDADAIADLAVAANMKYITFTGQHVLGRMFLYDTKASELNSIRMGPQRDFVAELAAACEKRGLGLFLYVMPPYSEPVIRERHNTMLTDLLTKYGPLAGVWFDGIAEAYKRPASFTDVSKTYALVRSLQPHCLISYKQGYTGEEDFVAPEWHKGKQGVFDEQGKPTQRRSVRPEHVRAALRRKHVERSFTLMHGKWFDEPKAGHRDADDVMRAHDLARGLKQNFLLNTGLRWDGSIHPDDARVLPEVGRRLRARSEDSAASGPAAWFSGKWGVMLCYLAVPASTAGKGKSAEEWSRQVDGFDVEARARQLKEVGASYLLITIGQGSGHYCAPNPVYDKLTGIAPSKCSRRDLVADLADALNPLGIKVIVYSASDVGWGDLAARKALGMTSHHNDHLVGLRKRGQKNSWQANREGQVEFLRNSIRFHEQWSKQWGTKVAGWWIDGCYHPEIRFPEDEPPNLATFKKAILAGNPDSIVTFNAGAKGSYVATAYEDYTPGEVSPRKSSPGPACPGGLVEGKGIRSRFHIMTCLGRSWGQGAKPRFPDEVVIKYTKNVTSQGGFVSWDVPPTEKGLIPEAFMKQLRALK